MEIDKSNASQIIGTPGVHWKANGVRYNARWEEMEFISIGEQEGDADVYRIKKKVGRPPVIKQEKDALDNTEKTEMPFSAKRFWSMKREDVIQSLRVLHVEFDPESNRNSLLSLLKKAQKKLPSDSLKRDK